MPTPNPLVTRRPKNVRPETPKQPKWSHMMPSTQDSVLESLHSSVSLLSVKVTKASEHLARLDLPGYDKLLDEHEREIRRMITRIEASAEIHGTRKTMVPLEQRAPSSRTQTSNDPTNAYDMFAELYVDNLVIASQLRKSVRRASELEDLDSAGHFEQWLYESERRAGFLLEACQGID